MSSCRLDRSLSICISPLLFLMTAGCSPSRAPSAEPAHPGMMMSGKTAEHCEQMKLQRQKMMEEMKAQDKEIDELVSKMNRAPRDKKMALMAEIITRLVRQRSAMHAKMEEMKGSMMEHRQMGKDVMLDCPMMK